MKHSFGRCNILVLGALGVTLAAFGENQGNTDHGPKAVPLPENSARSAKGVTAGRQQSRPMAVASTGQMLFQVSQQAQAMLQDQEAYREFLDSEALLIPSEAADPASVQPPSFLELEEQMVPDTVVSSADADGAAVVPLAAAADAGEAAGAPSAAAAKAANTSLGDTVSRLASHAATTAAREVDEAYVEQVAAMHSVVKGLTTSAFIAAVAVSLALAMLCNIGKSEWLHARRQSRWWFRSASPTSEIEVASVPKLASLSHESFSMPLLCAPEASSKVSTLEISRSLDGPPLQTRMCSSPVGGSWSQIEIGAGLGTPHSSVPQLESQCPLVVCKLVESAADAESRNVQGALESWLSLLLDEKSDHIADEEIHAPEPKCTCPPADGEPILEMCEGTGRLLGVLRLSGDESTESYSLVSPLGHTVLEVEANFNAGWMATSKNGQVVAVANFRNRHCKDRGSALQVVSEGANSATDSQELVQVDIVSGNTPEETALLLACTFALLVLECKAESAVIEGAADCMQREPDRAALSISD